MSLALILEETDNCSISKRIGFEKDAGVSLVFVKHTDNILSDLVFNNESIRGLKQPVLFVG
jgi:hypothetical protein